MGIKGFLRPTWLEIDLEALRQNLDLIKSKLALGVQIMGVVKANAYGHGAVQVGRALLELGVHRLGVSFVEEGIELREAGLMCPIHLLSEPPPESERELLQYKLTPAVCSFEGAKRISEYFLLEGSVCDAMIKIDTGMNRVGLRIEMAYEMVPMIVQLRGLRVLGLMSHFSASSSDPEYTEFQMAKFKELIFHLRSRGIEFRLNSIANSAALFLSPDYHLDMIRPGIVLYGLSPSRNCAGEKLQPIMSWKSRIVFLKEVRRGESVSYDRSYTAPKDLVVATLPVGYADGYFRCLSNKAEVLIGGKRCKVLGNVTMDQIMVDVTDVPGVQVGDEAVLIGKQGSEQITADELASLAGTINYEVVSRISSRVPRVYVR